MHTCLQAVMAKRTAAGLMCLTVCCGTQVNSMEITEGEYDRLWATNVKGTFELSQRLVPLINEGVMH